ncbi:MAG: TIGR04211 family SH3 domain-containing protein [Gammaproteobacteria bacterium]
MSLLKGLLPWLLVVAAAPAQAEIMYVTDILRLGLYADPATRENPLRYLTSGTALDVLERNGNTARVRGPDGAEGWVRATYLVSEEPARTRLAALESSNASLTEKLAAARRELAGASKSVASLESRLATAEDATRALEAAEQENSALERRIDSIGFMVPGSWVMAGLGVSLLLGFIAGLAFLDYLIRRRFGGVRIY